jgi:2'-deoxymugineic-acid 2'-dioxygenase / mugineic-acid 3-dioxygenase
VAERFLVPTRALGMELLRLLSEGVGLRAYYFDGDLSGGDVVVNVNHYLPQHCA